MNVRERQRLVFAAIYIYPVKVVSVNSSLCRSSKIKGSLLAYSFFFYLCVNHNRQIQYRFDLIILGRKLILLSLLLPEGSRRGSIRRQSECSSKLLLSSSDEDGKNQFLINSNCYSLNFCIYLLYIFNLYKIFIRLYL